MSLNRSWSYVFLLLSGFCVIHSLRTWDALEDELRYVFLGTTVQGHVRFIDFRDPGEISLDQLNPKAGKPQSGGNQNVVDSLGKAIREGYDGKVKVTVAYVTDEYSEATVSLPASTAWWVAKEINISVYLIPGEFGSARLFAQRHFGLLIPPVLAFCLFVTWIWCLVRTRRRGTASITSTIATAGNRIQTPEKSRSIS